MKTWQKAAVVVASVAGVAGISRVAWHYHHNYERFFPVEPNDVVLDVGASRGLFTIPAAKKAGLVIAVEAEPENAAVLRENVVRAGLRNVIVVQKAAWNRRTSLPLYLRKRYQDHTLFNGLRPHEMVEADTLDNIISELGIGEVDFLKMDIEGAEIEALEGAEQVLGMARKVVIAAYHWKQRPDLKPTHPWVSGFLRYRGFETHFAWPGLVHAWRESL